MFEYLCLMLVRFAGVKNPVESAGILYFKVENQQYKLDGTGDMWVLIAQTYQHNAPAQVDGIHPIAAGDWRLVLQSIGFDLRLIQHTL